MPRYKARRAASDICDMYQQINLYQPVFRHEQKVFSALTLLQLLGVMVLVLVGLYGGLRWQLGQLEGNRAALEAQRQQLTGQIETLEQAAAGGELETLDSRIAELEQQTAMLDRVLGEMDAFQAPQQQFSSLLTGLAQVRTPGLWLTRIELLADGGATLEGHAWQPERIPRYLEQLGDSERLGALGLNQVRIDNGPESGRVRFSLSNQGSGDAQSRLSRRADSGGPAS